MDQKQENMVEGASVGALGCAYSAMVFIAALLLLAAVKGGG